MECADYFAKTQKKPQMIIVNRQPKGLKGIDFTAENHNLLVHSRVIINFKALKLSCLSGQQSTLFHIGKLSFIKSLDLNFRLL